MLILINPLIVFFVIFSFFFFNQKTAYEMRFSDWSSDVCSSYLIVIYRALGWEPPSFAHLPVIVGADRKKLSKRHGDTAVREYRDQGYLPEAILNFFEIGRASCRESVCQ